MSGWRKRDIEERKNAEKHRKNLEFLLSLDEESLFVWYISVDEESRQYAVWLLKEYNSDLDKVMLLMYDGPNDLDFTQAKEVINSIKNKL